KDGLERALWPIVERPNTILHERHKFALPVDHDGRHRHHEDEREEKGDDEVDDGLYDVVHRPSESAVLAIHVAEININAAQNGDDITNLIATQQLRQDLQVRECRRANLGAPGIFRAIANHVDTQ